MYTNFFQMREMPFGLEPDSRFLVLAEEHKKALSTLIYAMREREGWALILGEAGVGKTTLVMALLRKMGEAVIPAVITNPLLEPMDFFNLVALELGMEGPYQSKGQFIMDLGQLINQCREQNRVVLLVVDEAHSLTPRLLEELRLLGNLDGKSPRVLNIFLVGQPKLLALMKETGVRGLMQRLRRHHLLQALSEEETGLYVRRRLEVAGGSSDIFDDQALREVHHITGGTPRLINALCDQALLTAFSNKQQRVDRDLVLQAARQSTDLLWPQLAPSEPDEPDEPDSQEAAFRLAPVQVDLAPEPSDDESAAEPPLEAALNRAAKESGLAPEPEPELEPDPAPDSEAVKDEGAMPDQEPAMEAPPGPDISETQSRPAPESKAESADLPESIRDLLEPSTPKESPPGLESDSRPEPAPSPARPKKSPGILGRLLLFLVFLLTLFAAVYLVTSPESLRQAARIWRTITIELGLEPSPLKPGGQPGQEIPPASSSPPGQRELRVKKPIPPDEPAAPPTGETPPQPRDDAGGGYR